MTNDGASDSPTTTIIHWCERCGREELLESEQAHTLGWDFPPRMGSWGVVSPRTCPTCPMKATVWWALAIDKLSIDDLTPRQRRTVGRILDEVPPST